MGFDFRFRLNRRLDCFSNSSLGSGFRQNFRLNIYDTFRFNGGTGWLLLELFDGLEVKAIA